MQFRVIIVQFHVTTMMQGVAAMDLQEKKAVNLNLSELVPNIGIHCSCCLPEFPKMNLTGLSLPIP
jgi:hypothetical protein